MTNETKQTAVDYFAKEIFYTIELLKKGYINDQDLFNSVIVIRDKAKEMDKEQHERFNKFLNDEIKLGISDKETVERIQWYYNTYFNKTYGGNK